MQINAWSRVRCGGNVIGVQLWHVREGGGPIKVGAPHTPSTPSEVAELVADYESICGPAMIELEDGGVVPSPSPAGG